MSKQSDTDTFENDLMDKDTEQQIFQKLDIIQRDVNETNITLASFMSGAKDCKNKCLQTHSAIYGNGSVGIRAKVWVMWGLFASLGGVVLAVIKGWIGIGGG